MQSNPRMLQLKQLLNSIRDDIGNNDVIYIDYPVHTNIGDLLIMLGTYQFFHDNKINIRHSMSVYDFDIDMLEQLVKKDKTLTIVLHGGGNYGDLYFLHQDLRRKIFKRLPEAKIVMLPQSLHYDSPEAEQMDIELISALKQSSFYVRDKNSLQHFKNAQQKVALAPDMAHQLYGALPTQSKKSHTDLYLLRQDIEKVTTQGEVESNQHSIDWQDIVTKQDRRALEIYRKILKRLDRLPAPLRPISSIAMAKIWKLHASILIRRACRLFNQHDRILTSRLHGFILARLLDKDCVTYDNSYKKIERYRKAWEI